MIWTYPGLEKLGETLSCLTWYGKVMGKAGFKTSTGDTEQRL